MNDEEYKRWASQLYTLSVEQRADLQIRLKMNGVLVEEKEQEDWLWIGVFGALRQRGLASKASEKGLKQTKKYKTYLSHRDAVMNELSELLPKGATVRSDLRVRFAFFVGETLIDWCEFKRLPKSSGIIIGMVHHSLEAINRAFPGYINSGHFGLVLESLLK